MDRIEELAAIERAKAERLTARGIWCGLARAQPISSAAQA